MSADETAPTHDAHYVQAELDKSRDSAARLLDSLARKIGAHRAVRDATLGFERAARYVHAHSAKDVLAGVNRALRRRPVYSIGAAVAAGYLVGCWIRKR